MFMTLDLEKVSYVAAVCEADFMLAETYLGALGTRRTLTAAREYDMSSG